MTWTTTLEEHVRAGRLNEDDARKIAEKLNLNFDMNRKPTIKERIKRLCGN